MAVDADLQCFHYGDPERVDCGKLIRVFKHAFPSGSDFSHAGLFQQLAERPIEASKIARSACLLGRVPD